MHPTATSLLFGLLATTHATPALPTGLPPGTPPPKSSEFWLAMNMTGYIVPLTAVYFETRGVLLKGAGTHDPYPRTPAYINTTFKETHPVANAIILDLTHDPFITAPAGVYGLSAADPGAARGVVNDVVATIDEQHFEFHIAEGHVGHEMTSSSQAWFACTRTIDGVRGAFLSWGTFHLNHSAPYGCLYTDVIQRFNLTRRAGSTWS